MIINVWDDEQIKVCMEMIATNKAVPVYKIEGDDWGSLTRYIGVPPDQIYVAFKLVGEKKEDEEDERVGEDGMGGCVCC